MYTQLLVVLFAASLVITPAQSFAASVHSRVHKTVPARTVEPEVVSKKLDLIHDSPYTVALCPIDHDDGSYEIFPCIFVMHEGERYVTLIDSMGEFAQFKLEKVYGSDYPKKTLIWSRSMDDE